MSFFSSAPDAPDEPEEEADPTPAPPWEKAPDGQIPVVLPVSELLARTENAALILAGVRVFGDGVELDVELRIRRGDLAEDDWDDLLDRAGGFGHRRRRGSSSRFRLGILLVDGTRVISDGPWIGEEDAPRARLSQNGGHGSGSDRSWVSEWSFWLWPLPADGPITVVAEWPQLGLAEASVVVDGAHLAAIAERVQPIWPDGEQRANASSSSWSTGFGG